MIPGTHALTIYQGATFRHVLRLTNATSVPIDLTGARVRMQVRVYKSAETVLLELTEDNGRATRTNPTGGEITLEVAAVDTALLNFRRGYYDLEIAWSDGTVDRVLEGTVTLSFEVTR